MNRRQRAILAVIAVVLGVQLAAQVAESGSTFWPFVPYPMYSWAHAAGSQFSVSELRIVSAGSAGESRAITHSDLEVKYFVFLGLLETASHFGDTGYLPEPDDAARLLSARISDQLGPAWSKVQIWERRFEIGEHGLLDRNPPLTLVREWSVPYATGGRD